LESCAICASACCRPSKRESSRLRFCSKIASIELLIGTQLQALHEARRPTALSRRTSCRPARTGASVEFREGMESFLARGRARPAAGKSGPMLPHHRRHSTAPIPPPGPPPPGGPPPRPRPAPALSAAPTARQDNDSSNVRNCGASIIRQPLTDSSVLMRVTFRRTSVRRSNIREVRHQWGEQLVVGLQGSGRDHNIGCACDRLAGSLRILAWRAMRRQPLAR